MPGSWAHAMRYWANYLLILHGIATDRICWGCGAVLLQSIIKLSLGFSPKYREQGVGTVGLGLRCSLHLYIKGKPGLLPAILRRPTPRHHFLIS